MPRGDRRRSDGSTVMDPVYLDHNATTLIRPEVLAAMSEAARECGNASSVHAWGRRARARVEDARERVAALVGAKPEWVVFTGSGTEANNLALRGIEGTVVVSAVEHLSVLNAREDAARLGVDADGVVTLDETPDGVALLSIMLANNETGVMQPVERAAKLARERGALVHCDAVQAAGRVAIDMQRLGVDMLSLSAHKLGGPQGVGALIVRGGVPLDALLRGGGQERGLRAGTENVAGIVGFGVAAEIALREIERMDRLRTLRDRIEAMLPEARVFGAAAERLPNTSCLAMPGVSAESQLMAFDLDGIMVSSGSACSSGKVAKSHVLAAMGVSDALADCAIRVSLGWTTTDQDVARFIDAWLALYARTRERMREVA